MKVIELQKIEHDYKIGKTCPAIEPNVTEDCILVENGVTVGFFLRSLPKKMAQLMDLANKELRSERVPKSMMGRSSGQRSEEGDVNQFSTIIGSVPPRPHNRRPYPSISSVHQVGTAQQFIKAMILGAKEGEKLIREMMPEQYEIQKKVLSGCVEDYRFTDLFTSSISNFNIPANFHRDTANYKNTVNIIVTKRRHSKGGNLFVPDYNACFDQCDGSILVYPAWKNVHGVTPIEPLTKNGYRNSLVFYPLAAFDKTRLKKNEATKK